MNKYPKEYMAQDLASHGRYGDTELVHMNPVEVAGIASLTPGGLTRNPVTGQLEAFNFMQSAIPMLAGYAGAAALTAATGGAAAPFATAMASGLSSGLATGAMTGDWERGLASGAIGAGVGGAMAGAAGNVAADAATDQVIGAGVDELASQALIDPMASTVIAEGAENELVNQALASNAIGAGPQPMINEMTGTPFVGPPAPPPPTYSSNMPSYMSNEASFGVPGTTPPPDTPLFGNPQMSNITGESYGNALKAPFQEGSKFGSELMKPSSMLPIALGANQLATMDAEDANSEDAANQEKEDNYQRENSYNRIQSAYRAAQPGVATGASPYRNQMSSTIPGHWRPEGYAEGGIMQFSEGGPTWWDKTKALFHKQDGSNSGGPPMRSSYGTTRYGGSSRGGAGLSAGFAAGDMGSLSGRGSVGAGAYGPSSPNNAGSAGSTPYTPQGALKGTEGSYDPRNGYYGMGIDPVSIQQGLRGQYSVAPPPSFRPGFDPEFDYFQDDPNNIQVPESTSPEMWDNMYPPFERMQQPAQFAPAPMGPPVPEGGEGMAGGGEVALNTTAGQFNIPAGGIADIQNEYTAPAQPAIPPAPQDPRLMDEPQASNPHPPAPVQAMPEAGGEPSDQDIQMLALAVTGQAGDEADRIVEAFIREFGVDTFREAREFILQTLSPEGNAQTEGMINGAGGGMDDQVQGTIGGQQPVAVSPGEFIVPADVVSGLGDGSSDAGAAELSQMMDNVRMARGGTTTQPQPFDAKQVLPA